MPIGYGQVHGRKHLADQPDPAQAKPKQVFKICDACKRVLEIEMFDNCAYAKDGHYNKCRECRAKQVDRRRK